MAFSALNARGWGALQVARGIPSATLLAAAADLTSRSLGPARPSARSDCAEAQTGPNVLCPLHLLSC